MGFDIGVSIDHLIFAELDAEKERRWDLTQANAEEFLQRYRQGNYSFTPMGVAQGWDPASYQRVARALVQMGYTHIAIGGLVRSQNTEIVRVLTAVQEVLRPGMQVHLFGVSRPDQVPTFMRLGITSFDSASRLRRAWMDGRRNYFLGDAAYSAIRIPEARALARKQHLDEHATIRMEQAAFATLRAFDRNEASLEATWEAAVAYAALSGKDTDRLKQDYRETLEVRPWQQCRCAICTEIGVEVIIFRGNNRNRRRGFHNTWQLYQHLQRIERHNGPPPEVVTQLTLEGEQVLDMEK